MATANVSLKEQLHLNGTTASAAGLLFAALRGPAQIATCSETDWDLFLRVARREGLLARIAIQFGNEAVLHQIPNKVLDHMIGARAVAADHARMIRWEVDRIRFALRRIETPVLLLKGAAYLLADLPAARGRLVSDVDILVPAEALHPVEAALVAAGWEHVKVDPYDQRYYRRWMHELPPLRHRMRETFIDVHHGILPKTSRLTPNPELLWRDSVRLADSRLRVLSPQHMVLHSAVHLFHDGDLDHGLRDLVDLHDLFETFGKEPAFWAKLTDSAQELGVSRPLFYSLRYTTKFLGTDIPPEMLALTRAGSPPWPVRMMMDWLVGRALVPEHPDYPRALSAFARWLLYLRSHYLRMPLRLLVPHLFRKALRRQPPSEEKHSQAE